MERFQLVPKDADSDIELTKDEEKAFVVYEKEVPNKIYHFYLSTFIDGPERYVEMVYKISATKPGDLVFLHLNTPGGCINTGIQLINAMQTSGGQVVTILEGEVCSLGTLLFLAGDELIVHDNCLFMIHNYSGWAFGKGHEQMAQVTATNKWFNKLAKNLYVPFLTEEEFNRMITGEDFWFDSDEVKKRIKRVAKMQEEKLISDDLKREERKLKAMEKKLHKLEAERDAAIEAQKLEEKETKPTRRRKPKEGQ